MTEEIKTTIVTTVITPEEIKTTVVTTPVEQDHAQAVGYSSQVEFYPPHPPRTETAEYHATHKLLVETLDTPCRFCGVRKSTLNTTQNIFKSKDLESHHYPIQRELTDACDWRKVARDFPTQVLDQKSFLLFIDSPFNMWICCDICHRGPNGVHHDVINNTVIRKYLLDGYILTGSGANTIADLLKDEAIVDADVSIDQRL